MSQKTKSIKSPVSVGTQLQKAREQHGLTTEEVAQALHIPHKQIQALEEDTSASVFSAPVYAFGALRSYASWLSLDTRSLERALAQQLKEADASRSRLRVHTVPRWYTSLVNPRIIIALAGGIVAVVIGSYIIWQIRTFWRLPDLTITQPESSVITQDTVTVAGITEEGAAVRINGDPVPLQDGTKFQKDIPLQPGITVIKVEAENTAGRIKTVEKDLLRPRDNGTLK